MKILKTLPLLILGLTASWSLARAQTSLETMKAAGAFRRELATGVVRGTVTAAQALQQLSARKTASGLSSLPVSEDQAQAELDIANDLMGRQRPDLAEYFFQAAEQSLVQAVGAAGLLPAKHKVALLKTLAQVRSSYLGKGNQAQDDIAEAARLQPDDKSLAIFAAQLRERSEGLGLLKLRK